MKNFLKIVMGLMVFLTITPQALASSFAENFSKVIDVRSRASADAKKNQPSTIVNVTNSGDTVTVSYAINNIQMDYVNGTDLARISVSKFFRNTDPSLPETSSRTDSFEVPEGYDMNLELVKAEYTEFNVSLPYSEVPKIDGYIPTVLDEIITEAKTDGFYPSSPVEMSRLKHFRGNAVQTVDVNPVQYDAASSTVRIYYNLEYRVIYTPCALKSKYTDVRISEIPPCNDVETREWMKENLTYSFPVEAEPLEAPQFVDANSTAPTLLILAHTSLQDAVEKLANYRRLTGYNVDVYYETSWTEQTIVNTIKSYKRAGNAKPKALLIFGNHAMLPSNKRTHYYQTKQYIYCSDIDYSRWVDISLSYDNDDYLLPEMLYGRIPANNLTEANNIVDKLIEYDKNPPQSDNFYKNFIVGGYFQDVDPTDGIEDSGRIFIDTSEAIKDHLVSDGKSVYRAYEKPTGSSPLYYNDGKTLLPVDLRGNSSIWNTTGQDIANKINDGVCMMFYRGHGSQFAWSNTSIELFKPSRYSLSNNNQYPFIWDTTCLNGAFHLEPNCFANCLLSKNKSGAIGVMAASQISYSGYNDYLARAILNELYTGHLLSSDGTPLAGSWNKNDKRLTAGGIMLSAIEIFRKKYSESNSYVKYTREEYNLLGDPLMDVYAEKPHKEIFTYYLDPNGAFMDVEMFEDGTISFFNHATNKVEYTNKRYARICFDRMTRYEDISVCVRPLRGQPSFMFAHNYPNPLELNTSTAKSKIGKITQHERSLNIVTEPGAENTLIEIALYPLFAGNVQSKPCIENAVVFDNLPSGYYSVCLIENGVIIETTKCLVK